MHTSSKFRHLQLDLNLKNQALKKSNGAEGESQNSTKTLYIQILNKYMVCTNNR